MKKYFLLFLLIFLPVLAQAAPQKSEEFFQARVIEVIKQETNTLPDGQTVKQQNLSLKALEGSYAGQELVFNGIGQFDVVSRNIYRPGDKVLVVASADADVNVNFYITDYVRFDSLFYLTAIFVIFLIAVSGFKGLRSLIALALSFLVVVKYLIPQILAGANPVLVTLASSLLILVLMIYLTEGWGRPAHAAVVSIFLSLVLTIALSQLFVSLAKLSGVASEEISYLITLGSAAINFRGLLLAGIIVGALGVLDDVVISQVSAVAELYRANRYLTRPEVFKQAYRIGVSHISSMTNTLFLAYAGVSMPLLILFISGQSAFSSFTQIVSNEAIATEIVRTLAGSIGLVAAVPIATLVAAWWLKEENK